MKIKYQGPRSLTRCVETIFRDISKEDYTRTDVPLVVIGLPDYLLGKRGFPSTHQRVDQIVEYAREGLSKLALRLDGIDFKKPDPVKVAALENEFRSIRQGLGKVCLASRGANAFYLPCDDVIYLDPMRVVLWTYKSRLRLSELAIKLGNMDKGFNPTNHAIGSLVHFDFGDTMHVKELRNISRAGLSETELIAKYGPLSRLTERLGLKPAEEAVACIYLEDVDNFLKYLSTQGNEVYLSERERWIKFYSFLGNMVKEKGKKEVLIEVKKCVDLSFANKTPLFDVLKGRNQSFSF